MMRFRLSYMKLFFKTFGMSHGLTVLSYGNTVVTMILGAIIWTSRRKGSLLKKLFENGSPVNESKPFVSKHAHFGCVAVVF